MKKSAGILLYRIRNSEPEFFLVHYGGPFWAKKDLGAWTIPKGEIDENESAFDAAKREFKEETGFTLPATKFIPLTQVKQKAGKIIHAFAAEGDFDSSSLISNEVEIEWPPRSGKKILIPEVDKGEWFCETEAKRKINQAQVALIDECISLMNK